MAKAPSFQFYAQDFDMDTATWENDEVGAYIRLLSYEWVNGGIPDDIEKIARIIREPLPDKGKRFHAKFERKLCEFDVKMRRNVLQKFSLNGNGLLVNSRMEQVRQQQRQYAEIQSEKGKHGANKRWGNKIAGAITQAMPALIPNDSSSSSSSNKENIIKEKSSYGEFKNVKLTDTEYQKLLSQFGNDSAKERIENLSQYIASKGKKYSSHYATILSWERKNKNNNSKSW